LLWKHFAEFQSGTNFIAWARKTAFHQILSYRRKSKRDPLPLSDEMLETVSGKVAALTDHDQTRREALESCLHRLSADQRRLILLRYQEELEVDEIAQKLTTTPGAVYRALSRLRLTLVDCVTSRLASHSPSSA
jgi:RNA polymerase sigma-70 factor (ECF subfamily)